MSYYLITVKNDKLGTLNLRADSEGQAFDAYQLEKKNNLNSSVILSEVKTIASYIRPEKKEK